MASNTPSIASKTMTQPDRIATALRCGALTVGEIADATGLSEDIVRVVLNRYANRYWLNIQEGQRVGRWGLLVARRDSVT